MTVQVVTPFKDGTDIIKESAGDTFNLCWQCSLCASTCPWNVVKNFIIPKLMRQAQFGIADFENEEWWQCTNCRACVRRCPRGVEISDVMRGVRRIVKEFGSTPKSLRFITASLGGVGNPMGEPREKRVEWLKNTRVKEFTKATEYLYFSCCVPAYDAKINVVARATGEVLRKTGTSFGIIGAQESCCGEGIRRAGNEAVFKRLAEENIRTFGEHGVKKVIVSSPHCYSAFKKDYPELGGNFEVLHFVEYLALQLRQGHLKWNGELKKRVIYHDPCYLGRHNSIYDKPREVLGSIPGVELVEFPDYRENALCCGGGGGRIWMETKKGERFSDIKVAQAVEAGADIIATACPYCIANFNDSTLTVDKAGTLEVRDISELVAQVL
jgi:Fe-S oxidoreductase